MPLQALVAVARRHRCAPDLAQRLVPALTDAVWQLELDLAPTALTNAYARLTVDACGLEPMQRLVTGLTIFEHMESHEIEWGGGFFPHRWLVDHLATTTPTDASVLRRVARGTTRRVDLIAAEISAAKRPTGPGSVRSGHAGWPIQDLDLEYFGIHRRDDTHAWNAVQRMIDRQLREGRLMELDADRIGLGPSLPPLPVLDDAWTPERNDLRPTG